MKKVILAILLCGVMSLCLIGCKKEKETSNEDLESVNKKIIEYFQTNGVKSYDTFLFNYVDEENNTVVVGLLDNSHEEQEKFKNTVIDSNLVRFVKGERFVDKVESNTKELKPFVRTYNILNVIQSNHEGYIYLTIRQFQEEEVQTIKVEKKLCSKFEVGKNYEFTIKPNKEIEDNLLSIFNNGEVLKIEKTNKIGLEQIQEKIFTE